jgi:hypothetical protein
MSFHNDNVFQIRGAWLGWVCEFSFKMDEPRVEVFKGGPRWVFGIPQKNTEDDNNKEWLMAYTFKLAPHHK